MRIRFHFRPVPFIAACLLVALGITLAQWQARRAVEKSQIQTQMVERLAMPAMVLSAAPVDAGRTEFRRVRAHGHFLSNWPLYLDNRPQDGRPGMYVVMPFEIAGSSVQVLVERGWIPLNRSARTVIFPYLTPAGETDIVGVVRRHAGHVMQLGTAAPLTAGAIVQNLDEAAFSKAAGLTLLPVVIEQNDAPESARQGLVRDWPKPSSGIERHQGYAFQWYALAIMAFLFFVVTGFRREPD